MKYLSKSKIQYHKKTVFIQHLSAMSLKLLNNIKRAGLPWWRSG